MPATAIDLVDTSWLRAASESVRAITGSTSTVNYVKVREALESIHNRVGFRPAEATVALVAMDLSNVGQDKFCTALEKQGYLTDRVDYRHAYASTPPNDRTEKFESSLQTLAPWLCYSVGLMAGRSEPQVVVVTGAFEVYGSLIDFCENRNGRACVAYFTRWMDPRWTIHGLGRRECPIRFVDLDEYSGDILGVDLNHLALNRDASRKTGRPI